MPREVNIVTEYRTNLKGGYSATIDKGASCISVDGTVITPEDLITLQELFRVAGVL